MTKVAVGWKISLLRDVADKLDANIGDKVVYFEEGDRVYIEKA